MISQDFQKQVRDYGLTTAHILYRRHDHPWLLQSYVCSTTSSASTIRNDGTRRSVILVQ